MWDRTMNSQREDALLLEPTQAMSVQENRRKIKKGRLQKVWVYPREKGRKRREGRWKGEGKKGKKGRRRERKREKA